MLIIVIFSDADIGTFGQSRTSCPLTLREITVFFFYSQEPSQMSFSHLHSYSMLILSPATA